MQNAYIDDSLWFPGPFQEDHTHGSHTEVNMTPTTMKGQIQNSQIFKLDNLPMTNLELGKLWIIF